MEVPVKCNHVIFFPPTENHQNLVHLTFDTLYRMTVVQYALNASTALGHFKKACNPSMIIILLCSHFLSTDKYTGASKA